MMYIEKDDSKTILKYLDDGTKIHQTAHLRSYKNPAHREILAITSSSLVKFSRHKKQVVVNMIYLRHVTGMKLALDLPNWVLLAIGVIFAIIGAIFAIIIVGIPIIIVGLVMIYYAFANMGGILQFFSYSPDDPFVDVNFTRGQRNHVIKIAKEVQKLLSMKKQPIVQKIKQKIKHEHKEVSAPPSGMKHCNACGGEIRAEQKFCDKCGAGQ